MTSSNKARRYLQHHKQHYTESHNSHQSAAELLVIDPTLAVTTMRKFRGKIQQQQLSTTVSIPQICVDDDDDNDNNNRSNDDDNGHVAILDEFDEVLENELKRTSVLRTSSLKQKESNNQIGIPINQQRSFSFALGSSTNLDGKKHNDNDDEEEDEFDNDNHDEVVNRSSIKSTKLPTTIKSSLSKETFSRLLHSFAFRSGNHSTSKITMTSADSQTQQQQRPCLACQNHPNLDLLPKYKKRPSIFGVLVSKLNTNITTNEHNYDRCPVCKRRLSKSIFYNTITNNNTDDDNQQISSSSSSSTQKFSLSSLGTSKLLHDHGQILSRTKRRRSLPSLFQSLFDFDHHDNKRRLDNTQIQHRPSFSSILTHTLLDSITREQQQQQQQSIGSVKQTSPLSYSSISLAGSDDSKENNYDKSYKRQSTVYDDSSQLTEKVSK
ncbi:unnamed protein product [Rotaria sp. Silwood2]|nr:unnamed protein product [Rotaria sp. Silwood2]CAF3922432.1 unnamed protein product [Rotaria sp. Silwood2]